MTIHLERWTRPEERSFLRRALDWVEYVRSQHNWKLTDFLSPRELHLLESTVRNNGFVLSSFGGSSTAERKRVLVMPEDWYPQESDFQVDIHSVITPTGVALSHGGILGSVLGTGLERRKIGDIFTRDGTSFLAVCHDVSGFLTSEWHQVGKESVVVEKTTELLPFDAPKYERQTISVASLRVDAVVAQTCHWSRSDAQSALESGKVSLNFTEIKRTDTVIEVGDILSVRGFGRIAVTALLGASKKGRERVEVGVLRSNQPDRG